jgi:hypothetical protein
MMDTMRHRGLPLASLILAIVLAAPAAAATVTADIDTPCSYPGASCDTGSPSTVLTFRAAAGEANQVTVARVSDAVVVHDATAPLTPGAGVPEAAPCVAVDEHTVSCPAPVGGEVPFVALVAQLGDEDDTFAVSGGLFPGQAHLTHYVQVKGGAGDDRIAGSSTRDFVDPGRGHDTVSALGGNDVVHAVDGQRDVVDGGAGFNRATADRVDVVRRFATVKRRGR